MLQNGLLNEESLSWENLVYPVKNGIFVDPLARGGLYQVKLVGIARLTSLGFESLTPSHAISGDVKRAMVTNGFIDDEAGELTRKGKTVLFHSCYRTFPFSCGEYTIAIETSYLIGENA